MKLLDVMKALRDPKSGCPWDQAQTHESLMPYLLEETFEVRDALLKNGEDSEAFAEELGDLLFQVVFHAQLLTERRGIDFNQIADRCADKLIRRHPHVFDPAHPGFDSATAVNSQWEQLKGAKVSAADKLGSIPAELPALQRAYRLGEKAASLGFDWPSSSEAWTKVQEELAELQAATTETAKQEELGDLLFALAQWARKERLEPEWTLTRGNEKFQNRFLKVDALAGQQNLDLKKLSSAAILDLWRQAKAVDSQPQNQ